MDSEDFKGQVHPDQYSIAFWPEPGDIIIRKVIDHNCTGDDHVSDCLFSAYGIAELYKDNFYAFPERCPDPAKRAAYHRIFFRNGDHIIRRSRFKREKGYAYTEEDYIRVWVYWPGYQLHSTFIRLISWSVNAYGVHSYEAPRGRFRFRAQTFRFAEGEVEWEPGDIVVRYFEPGPPGAPNPGWYRLIGVQEVDVDSDMDYMEDGDLLIKHKGRQELPPFPTDPVKMNTRMEIYVYIFHRDGGGDRFTYLCGDSMLYDLNDWDSVMRLHRADGIPQPADILISQNEEFTVYDPDISPLGGYVKFYQNPATSIDPKIPSTMVYNPTRVPADGATTSSAPPPNLPRPEQQAGWVEPRWDHLSVPQSDAAHPMVLRFGRWAEETSPHAEAAYKWIWNPYLEFYQRHPRSHDGQTYFLADRTGVNYGEGRGLPAWEEFTDVGLDMNNFIPMEHFPVVQGDVIIRRDLRHNVHPILTHGLMPATNAGGIVRCCPGDLLVRYGLIKEPNAPNVEQHEAEGRNRYHFGVELYVLALNHNILPMWSFRGRDQVIFGFVPNPKAVRNEKMPAEPCRLQGMFDGSMYYYDAPGSKRVRTALVAVERGQRQVTAGAAQAQKRRRSQGSATEEEGANKENPKKKLSKFTIIEATRPKVITEVLIPKFLNHETGNYKRVIGADD